MKLSFPKHFSFSKHQTVDICVVLKEPTLALDFSAKISRDGNNDDEECLKAIAKGIRFNASLVGEKVFADVVRDRNSGEFQLFITKPYLERGMVSLHLSSPS